MCRTAKDVTFFKQHEKGEHCGLHFTLHWALITPVMEPGETMFAHPRSVSCGQPVGHGHLVTAQRLTLGQLLGCLKFSHVQKLVGSE